MPALCAPLQLLSLLTRFPQDQLALESMRTKLGDFQNRRQVCRMFIVPTFTDSFFTMS
jgi:hypothetical protein